MHDFCLIFLSSIYSSHFVTDIAEQGRLNSKISALQAERSGVWKGSPSGRRRAGSTPRSSSSWRQQKIWNEISTYTKWKEHNWLDGEPGRPFGPVEWSEGALPVLFTVLNFVLRLRKLTPALWSCVLSTLALTHVFSQDFQATLTQRIRNEFIYIYTIFLFVVLILTVNLHMPKIRSNVKLTLRCWKDTFELAAFKARRIFTYYWRLTQETQKSPFLNFLLGF